MDAVWADLIEDCRNWTQQRRLLQGHRTRVHALHYEPSDLAKNRHQQRNLGTTWPDWCYFPSTLQTVALAHGLGWGTSDDAVLPMTNAATAIAGVAAWHAAPLIARFDDDLAAAVMDTPLTGEIPFDSLRRLPAWAVVIPVPWLRADALALIWADTGQVHIPATAIPAGDESTDEIFVMVLVDDDSPVTARLRFSEPTIAASIAAQNADADANVFRHLTNTRDANDVLATRHNTTAAELLQNVLALALYISSEQADVVDAVTVEHSTRRARTTAATGTAVIDVGFRIGAALRSHRSRSNADDESLPTGLTQAPHIRSAHWHTYWFGPRSQPELRYRATRWLPPIGVNIDLARAPVTIRPVPNSAG